MDSLDILTDIIASIPDVNLQILLNELDLNVWLSRKSHSDQCLLGQKILGYLKKYILELQDYKTTISLKYYLALLKININNI